MIHNDSKGFTLIELMIVVAIIGVLASIAIPKFADMVTHAKEASVRGQLGAVRSAINIYYADNEGVFPTNCAVGLTANAKYLTVIPTIQIPPVVAQANPGHSASSQIGQCGGPYDISGLPPCISSGIYDYAPSSVIESAGTLIVSCTHLDSRGNLWTAS